MKQENSSASEKSIYYDEQLVQWKHVRTLGRVEEKLAFEIASSTEK